MWKRKTIRKRKSKTKKRVLKTKKQRGGTQNFTPSGLLQPPKIGSTNKSGRSDTLIIIALSYIVQLSYNSTAPRLSRKVFDILTNIRNKSELLRYQAAEEVDVLNGLLQCYLHYTEKEGFISEIIDPLLNEFVTNRLLYKLDNW